ncbi:MAG: CCA tRNA nucleotidyltransferase [Rickettsiales bacterium]
MRFVGGCVRDGLMQRPLGDLDAATTALPDKIIAILEKDHIRAVPTGFEHGTVTAIFQNRSIEITTLRKDAACDGRHASVEYTNNWQEDAARRDFTINALYLDSNGTIYDYFEGQKDLAKKSVRFIGNADERITEDYLRILRFFRFLATHGSPPADAEALEACRKAKDQLLKLSGERLQTEMVKLLTAKNPAYALQCMEATGVLALLLGSSVNLDLLQKLLGLEQLSAERPHPLLRLSFLLTEENLPAIADRWRMSRKDSDLLKQLVTYPPIADEKNLKRATLKLGKNIACLLTLRDGVRLRYSADQVIQLLEHCKSWEIPVFPVSGDDLIKNGMQPGKQLGDTIKILEKKWEDSNYMLDKITLLDSLK